MKRTRTTRRQPRRRHWQSRHSARGRTRERADRTASTCQKAACDRHRHHGRRLHHQKHRRHCRIHRHRRHLHSTMAVPVRQMCHYRRLGHDCCHRHRRRRQAASEAENQHVYALPKPSIQAMMMRVQCNCRGRSQGFPWCRRQRRARPAAGHAVPQFRRSFLPAQQREHAWRRAKTQVMLTKRTMNWIATRWVQSTSGALVAARVPSTMGAREPRDCCCCRRHRGSRATAPKSRRRREQRVMGRRTVAPSCYYHCTQATGRRRSAATDQQFAATDR